MRKNTLLIIKILKVLNEEICEHVINLPTYLKIGEKEAQQAVEFIADG